MSRLRELWNQARLVLSNFSLAINQQSLPQRLLDQEVQLEVVVLHQ